MAKAKIIKGGTVHLMRDGVLHTLRPGDKVPDWATITNPRLLADAPDDAASGDAGDSGDAGSGGSGDAGGTAVTVKAGDTGGESTETTPAKEPTVKELRETAKTLGIPQGGSKDELTARIDAKRAEIAAEAGDDAGDDGAAGDEPDTGRAALEARATELGIEFDENNSDDELAALIEDQE